jgi:hypothetical protein
MTGAEWPGSHCWDDGTVVTLDWPASQDPQKTAS